MKTNNFIIETEKWTAQRLISKVIEADEATIIKVLQKSYAEKIIRLYDGNEYHICKYCGNVVKGKNEDLLCKDCKETFGHNYYTEL